MSHIWTGYWEQDGYGRQPMHDLVLHFDSGDIKGHGSDIIGRFTFSGRLESDGGVLLTKQYVGQHTVLYHGQCDGEGTIYGQWSIGPWYRGDFLLRLGRSPGASIADEAVGVKAD